MTPTVTDTPTRTSTPTPFPPLHIDVTPFPALSASAYPCLIFVHGKRTNTDTFTNWNDARDYWKSGSRDLVREATKNFAASYYVVGYNGSQAYWDAQAAGEVANEIVNASNGGNDGGGNHCARTYAEGGTFWVVGHSMAGSVIDYILGNDDPSDPNYNLNGPYDVAAARLSLAITIAGTHRGSQGADLVCGGGNPFCSFFAGFVQDCDTATYWLRSSDDVQVRSFANSPREDSLADERVCGHRGCQPLPDRRGRRHCAVRLGVRVQWQRDRRLRYRQRLQQQQQAGVVRLPKPRYRTRNP